MQKLVNVILMSILLLSVNLYAQDNTDPCADLSGTWRGSTNVKLFVVSCQYNTTAQVSEGNPASINIEGVKSSGPFFCPRTIARDSKLLCDNRKLSVKDNAIDVSGELSNDGRQAYLNGIIHILGKHAISLTVSKYNS